MTDTPTPVLNAAMQQLCGVWEGTVRHYDSTGAQTETHRVHTECKTESGGLHRTVSSTWADGRTERRAMSLAAGDGQLEFNTDGMRGHIRPVALVDNEGGSPLTTLGHWTLPADPGVSVFAVMQTAKDGERRAGTWQWFKNGACFARTTVDERRIAPG